MRITAVLIWGAALWLCVSGFAVAQQAPPATPPALGDVYNCVGITEDSARLACFDSSVGALRAAEQQGEFAAVDVARAENLERESFGFSLPSLSRLLPRGSSEEPVDRIETQVDRVVTRAYGFHAFVLQNGQTWVQVEPGRASNVRAGGAVSIRRATLGSYMMHVEAGGLAHRVRREE